MRLLRRSWDLFRNALGWLRRNRRGRRAAAAKRRATLRRHAYDRLEARVVLNADAVDDELSTGYGVPAVIARATLTANDTGTGTLAVTSFSATTAQGGTVDDVGGNLIYTPPANFSGDDSFTYQLTDDDATTDTATVTLHVAAQPPLEAHDDTFVTNEDTPGWPELSGNDDLPASWSLELVEGPSHGTLPSLWYYVPDANYAGPDSFRYRLTDGVRTSEATVSITVNAVNDAPTAEHRTYAMDEDGTLERTAAEGLLVGAGDVEGDGLAAELASQAAHGTATVASDGSFTYTPNANFSGVDSFTYRVFDGTDYSAARTVSITVNPTDDDLEAVDDEGVTDEDIPLSFEYGLNDVDPDQNALTTILTQPEHGTVDVESDGFLRYTPQANWHGVDAFTYRRSDGVHQDDATVTVTVTPVNDPPTAVDDELATDEDGPLALSSALTANDSDVEGDAQIEILSQPEHGAVGVVEGVLTFTPEADWFGTTSFTYRLIDADYQSAAATVTVTVAPVNDAPTSAGRAYDVDEDQTLAVGAENGLLVDAADVESNSIAVTPYDGATAQGGHVVVAADGSFTYTPAADFHGTDSFDYELSDGSDTSVAAATITVAPVNDAPTAAGDSRTIDEDTSLSVGGSDIDGDPLTAVVVAQPSHGTVTLDGGSVSYTPDANWSGSDSFQYRVSDGSADSSTATVWITVNPVNDAPWAADQSHTVWVTHHQTDAIAVPDPTNYGDVDGDGLNVSYGAGLPVFVAPGQSGSRSYTVTDPSGTSAGGTVYLTVNVYDNRTPSAGGDQQSLDEDTSITFDPRANDSDADGDGLIVSLDGVAGPQHGTVALNGDGTLTYTPEADYFGGDSFQYRVDDGWGGSSVATVSVTIRSVNDAPTFTAGADVTVDEDSGAYSQSWASQIGVGPANESAQQPTFTVTADDPSLFTAEGGPRLSAGGTLSFTPAPNAHGTTTVTVWLSDDGGTANNGRDASPAVTFTLTITSINDPPTAADDEATGQFQQPITIDVAANDSDPDDEGLTVVAASSPDGTVTFGGGSLTFTPHDRFAGRTTIDYTIADAAGETASAVVRLTVTPPELQIEEIQSDAVDEGSSLLVGVRLSYRSSDLGVRVDVYDPHDVLVASREASYNPTSDRFELTHVFADDNPTGTPSDAYRLVVTATDSAFAQTDVGQTSVTVRNVTPRNLSVSLDAEQISEGESVGLVISFDDPGTDEFTIEIDWGDGTDRQTFQGPYRTFSARHTYRDDGPSPGNGTRSDTHSISVRVHDDDDSVNDAAADVALTVDNQPPWLEGLTLTAEGDEFVFAPWIGDRGVYDAHEWDAAWSLNDEESVDRDTFRTAMTLRDKIDFSVHDITDDDTGTSGWYGGVTYFNAFPTPDGFVAVPQEFGGPATVDGNVLLGDVRWIVTWTAWSASGPDGSMPIGGYTLAPALAERFVRAELASQAEHGSVGDIADDGSFTYTASQGYLGTDSFTYALYDRHPLEGDGYLGEAQVTVFVLNSTVDLDIDSDNTNGLERSEHEDEIEGDPAHGKIVFADTGDFDGDGIPDNVDYDGIVGMSFTPIVLQLPSLPEGVDSADVRIRFDYAMADLIGDGTLSTSGTLRLWKVDATFERGEAKFVRNDHAYTLAELGVSGRTVTLYVEAVRGSTSDLTITVKAKVGNRTLEDTVYVTPVSIGLKQIDFGATEAEQYFHVTRDDARKVGDYPVTGQWRDEDGDGKPEQEAPLAYRRGATMTVDASFAVTASSHFSLDAAAGIRLSGLQTDGYNFTAEGNSEDPENVLEYSGGVLRLKARAAKAFENKVGYFDPFKIVWSLELPSGGTTLSLGTSSNQAYVLFDKPLQTTLYHTVAHLAATAAAGVDAADEDARDKIIRQIWAEFDDEVVRRVKTATQEGVVLKYSHLDSDGVEIADLLEDGSGRCGSWARLLAATFRAMGINAKVWKILPANDPPLVYPGTHYGTRALQTVPSAAQGTFKAICEERTFEDHAVVAVPTAEGMSWQPIIYDPSYGNSFAAGTVEAALIKWEDESLQYPFIAAVLNNNDTNTPKIDIFGNPIYATAANAIGTYDANVKQMGW